jgi:hypothetical protein
LRLPQAWRQFLYLDWVRDVHFDVIIDLSWLRLLARSHLLLQSLLCSFLCQLFEPELLLLSFVLSEELDLNFLLVGEDLIGLELRRRQEHLLRSLIDCLRSLVSRDHPLQLWGKTLFEDWWKACAALWALLVVL